MANLTKNYIKGWSDDSKWIINTPSDFARSTLFYVQEIGFFSSSKEYLTEQQNISSFLLMLTMAGEGEYTYQDHIYKLTPNSLVFVDSMESHFHRTSPTSPANWDILWVQFKGSSTHGYYNQFKTKGLPVIDIGQNTKIPNLMQQLLDINHKKSLGIELLSSRLIVSLLTEILFLTGAVISPKKNYPDFINAAISDIDSHFNNDLSLDYFAKSLAISKFYFIKEFKKYTGFTPNEYIINTRINYAKRLLQNSDKTISSISETVGFKNTCHFINTFKSKVHITPLKFRKQYTKQYLDHQEE